MESETFYRIKNEMKRNKNGVLYDKENALSENGQGIEMNHL